jgi:dCMP deaminase
MFTRSLPHEKEMVAAVIRAVFPHFTGDNVRRIDRGISNVKYWLTHDARTYVVKIYSGDRHRQRAAAEFSVMSLATHQRDIGVPAPVAWSCDDALPVSYVVMTGVDGIPLDEAIDLLTMDQIAALGAQTGILLDRLHSLADLAIEHVPRQLTTPVDQLAGKAQAMGVLTADQSALIAQRAAVAADQPPAVLLHGDLGWDNIIIRTAPVPHLVALVDFEHSMLGAAEYDFVKSSVASGERASVFTSGLITGYTRAQHPSHPIGRFRADVARAEVVTDLTVALDLARDPFRDVYGMATTEHRAWQHVARLYRSLAMVPDGQSDAFWQAAVPRTLEIARQSTCRVRQVGAMVLGPDGTEAATGFNDMHLPESRCWCADGMAHEDRPRCPARHAEANVIRQATVRGIPLRGRTLICTTCPCLDCARRIARAGLGTVLYIDDYIDTKGLDYLLAAGVHVRKVPAEPIPR